MTPTLNNLSLFNPTLINASIIVRQAVNDRATTAPQQPDFIFETKPRAFNSHTHALRHATSSRTARTTIPGGKQANPPSSRAWSDMTTPTKSSYTRTPFPSAVPRAKMPELPVSS